MNTQLLLDKLYLLESKLGGRYTHTNLEPFVFDSTNPIEVQNAAKKISEFIGIYGLTFIVTYSSQKANVGGYIELGNQKEVFIEINSNIKSNCAIVLYVLAHEICHKYLQINNIRLFPELENEILTDTATIYTGLGKLTLNGCNTTTQLVEKNSQGSTTTTTTHKLGYLDSEQFAFIYKTVCEMRRVPFSMQTEQLTKDAKADLKNVEIWNFKYFRLDFFESAFVDENNRQLKTQIGDLQKLLAQVHKDLRLIEQQILPQLSSMQNEYHLFAKNILDKFFNDPPQTNSKEPHNYLKNVILWEELGRLENEVFHKTEQLKKIPSSWSEVVNKVSLVTLENHKNPTFTFLFQFECPICKHKLRIGEKKLARVTCNKCNYRFIVDTGVDPSEAASQNKETILTKSEGGIFSKIKTIFRY